MRKVMLLSVLIFMMIAFSSSSTSAQEVPDDLLHDVYLPLLPSCMGMSYNVRNPVDYAIISLDGIRKVRVYNGEMYTFTFSNPFWCLDLSEYCSVDNNCLVQIIADDPYSDLCWKSDVPLRYAGGYTTVVLERYRIQSCTFDMVN